MSDFERAQEIVKREVEWFFSRRPLGVDAEWYSLWFGWKLRWAENQTKSWIQIPLGSDETIALSAMQNEAANSLAREIVASRLLAEVFLPTHLAMFAALCVQGKANATQRKKPGKKRSRNWERDHFIICLVEQLVEECGVLATQNNQPSIKSPTPKSAAGIISQEFARHGVHETTPRAIKEVWSNRKKRQVTDIVNGLMDSYSANPINALAYI